MFKKYAVIKVIMSVSHLTTSICAAMTVSSTLVDIFPVKFSFKMSLVGKLSI